MTESAPAAAGGSYRQILRSSTVVGGASVAQVLLGLIRMKAAALIVGVTGVGLIGLFANLVLTAGTFGGLGIGAAATRQIAADRSRAGEQGEAVVRHALASATLFLAAAATIVVWLLRTPIARLALGDQRFASAVGWLSIGVGLTIVATSQTSLLAGLRRMGAIARTYVVAGLIATIAGTLLIYLFAFRAIAFFVIVLPLANVIAGAWFVARLPRPSRGTFDSRSLPPQWRQLGALGIAIMGGQLLANAAQLGVRGAIAQRLGFAELGLFQAAWMISVTYLGIVLQAMAADYYPRLSEAIHEQDRAVRLVNEQTEVALLLGGPIILAGLGLAPLGLEILYSSAFRPAAELLRWQMLGDVLKIASWPAGFVLLAANRGGLFLLLEAIGWAVFVATTWLLLPSLGLKAAGIAVFVMYCVYLPLVFLAAKSVIGIRWSRAVGSHFLIVAGAAIAVFALAYYDLWLGMTAGAMGALLLLAVAATRLRERIAVRPK
jgi:PST family polysaccharide transporter